MKNKAATFRVLKTCISALMFAVGGMFMATAQNPGIPYQAYIIDKVGGYAPGKQIEVPLANADILLEFEIRNENGVVEYKERIPAKTDEFGMVSTVIGVGNGTPTEGAFEDIVWNGKPKKMHIDSDLTGTGSNFNDHGEMELVHIPGPSGVVITPGIGAPTATNPAGPNAGDIYVDEATGDLYTFDGTNWVPQPGVAINPGAGAPTATNPANPDSGDMYVDESTGEIYVYDGTSWVNTVDANETVTTLVDNGDGTSTYTDENNQPNPITNTVTAANASIADGTIDIDGDGTADNNVSLQDVTDNIINIIDANETVTTLVDNGDGTSTYTDENNQPNPITNTVTAANASIADGTIDIDGDGTADNNVTLQDVTDNINNIIAANETLTSLTQNTSAGTLTYTGEDGISNTFEVLSFDAGNVVTVGSDGGIYINQATIAANETDTSLAQDLATGVITYTAEDGLPDTANVVSATPGNIVTVGTDGGAFVNQATIAANETDTSLAQDLATGVITYTAEDGLPDTANVVSADTNNALSVGGDGGAFINTSSLGTDDQVVNTFQVNGNNLELEVEDGGGLKTVALNDIAREPWFGTDDNAAATTNTENMYVMGNIGVGTSTLSTGKVATFAGDVDIQGVLDPTKIIMSGDGSVGSFNPTTNNQYEIEFQEGRDLEIKSNTTNNIMHIENTGNVGIGEPSPTSKLEVKGKTIINFHEDNVGGTSGSAVNDPIKLHIGNPYGSPVTGNRNGGLQLEWYNGNFASVDLVRYGSTIDGAGLAFGTSPNNSGPRTESIERMRIDRNGNVGIGETSPTSKLEVKGKTIINFHEDNVGGTSGSAVNDPIKLHIGNPYGSPVTGNRNGGLQLEWYNGNFASVDLVRYDNSGDGAGLAFGTSPNSSGPRTESIERMRINRSGNVGIDTTDPTQRLDVNGGVRVRSLGTGTVQSDATGILSVSSDERLKNITANFNRGLNAVLGLQPISYKWNNISGLDMQNTYAGFSAQNVQANIPEAVGVDNKGYLTLSDRPIIAALVNSVKELKKENEDLKARLAKIEAALGL